MAKKSSKNTVKVNFKGVESKGGTSRVKEGDYKVKISAAKSGTSNNDNPKVDFQYTILEGPFKGKRLFDTVTLTKEALWKFKKILEACGKNVNEKALNI